MISVETVILVVVSLIVGAIGGAFGFYYFQKQQGGAVSNQSRGTSYSYKKLIVNDRIYIEARKRRRNQTRKNQIRQLNNSKKNVKFTAEGINILGDSSSSSSSSL